MSGNVLTARPVVITLVLVLAFVAYRGWTAFAGARKLTDSEIAEAAASSEGGDRLDLRVVLPFEPEQFHFMLLQQIGRMAGADGRAVSLRGVPVDDARRLARQYWVADLEPLEAE